MLLLADDNKLAADVSSSSSRRGDGACPRSGHLAPSAVLEEDSTVDGTVFRADSLLAGGAARS
jgi:hypothetical protein